MKLKYITRFRRSKFYLPTDAQKSYFKRILKFTLRQLLRNFEVSHPRCVYHIHRVNEICTRNTVKTQLYYQEVVH
jgi:hypothetical protein